MDQGATIGYDRFGLDMFNPTADRVRTITALCAQGCADRIVLSRNASCYMDFFSGEATYSMLRQAVPNWNFLHISQDVLPALRKQGVTEGQFTATSPEARSEPNGSYRDFPHAQPLPASGCSG